MPQGDGTGPQGQGPMKGRGKGRCSTKEQQPNNRKKGKAGRRQDKQKKDNN